MDLIASLLERMAGVSQPQKKFLLTLFTTILLLQGKVNFRNLSRYSDLSEKTYARQYRKPFDFAQFNRCLIEELSYANHERIAAIDCSFIPKSGRQTYGLDRFYDASHKQVRKGLEISTIALIDVTTTRGYALHTQQTPPDVELADVVAVNAPTAHPRTDEFTRVDFYVSHLQAARAYLPSDVAYLVGDGYYAKLKVVEGTRAAGLHLISKLRGDAD
ncbi:MAG: transposase, partial [Chloroflexota bacterium]|nr:transposase [Chloroflexota bacterium]